GLVYDGVRFGAVNGYQVRYVGWRLHQELLVAAVASQVTESLDGLLRRVVRGNPATSEQAPGFCGSTFAEPACEHRRMRSRTDSVDDGASGFETVRDGDRAVHDEDCVGARVAQQSLECSGVARALGISKDVDGVPARR